MTAEPIDTDEVQAVRIGGAAPTRNTEHDRFPFYLGDDDTVLWGTRPKMAVLLDLVAGMTDDGDQLAQARTFNVFLSKVLAPESEEYLRGRFMDDDDDLDLDHPDVEAMFKTLIEVWYGARPTGGRPGSRGSSARTGRGSTVRSRSKGSTR